MMRLPGGNNILGNGESNLGEHHEGKFSDAAKHRIEEFPALGLTMNQSTRFINRSVINILVQIVQLTVALLAQRIKVLCVTLLV